MQRRLRIIHPCDIAVDSHAKQLKVEMSFDMKQLLVQTCTCNMKGTGAEMQLILFTPPQFQIFSAETESHIELK